MTKRFWMSIALICGSALVMAQAPPAFIGAWKVTWAGAKRPQEATLVISETGGTWKTAASSRTDACVGRTVPIAFEKVTDDEADVRLKFSEALPGCADAMIRIKRVDEKSMKGSRGDAELTLVRE